MPKSAPTDHFIKKKIDVENAETSATVSLAGGGRAATGRDIATASILLLGLPGSGHVELGRLLAEQHGLELTDLSETADGLRETLEAPASARIVLLGPVALRALAREEDAVALATGAGRAFYLMSDVPAMVQRVGIEQRETLAKDLAELEPFIQSVTGNILLGRKEAAELAEDLKERLALG